MVDMSQTVTDLSERIIILHDSLKQTLQLIQRLSTFHSQTTTEKLDVATPKQGHRSDETVLDLSGEIHDALNQQEEELELLKLDVEDAVLPVSARKVARREGERDRERDREANNLNARCVKLTEDIVLARSRFRKAQLQAKHSADLALIRERNEYLASLQAAAQALKPNPEAMSSSGDHPHPSFTHAEMRTSLFARRGPSRTATSSNATKDDMILTASSDLTSSLRRTHALISNELSRSRFAHETLEASNAALQDLGTKYGALDDLLGSSRRLLGTLLSSQKTDTWYLTTALYVLIGTIVWLLFRRLVYGPMWWLVWFPVRTAFRTGGWAVGSAVRTGGWAVGGAVGLVAKDAKNVSAATSILATQAVQSQTVAQYPLPAVTVSSLTLQPDLPNDDHESNDNLMSDMVARMVEASQVMVGGTATADDDSIEAGATQTPQENVPQQQQVAGQAAGEGQAADQAVVPGQPVRGGDGRILRDRDPIADPPNPKKRMFEDPPPLPKQQQEYEQHGEL